MQTTGHTMARTRGAKLAVKRGRPRKEGVSREPSGRISRRDEAPARTALEARARMFGISQEDAMNQEAGTFMGRLHMAYVAWAKVEKSKPDGKKQPEQSLSTAQYHALLSCQQAHNDFLCATGAPGAQYDRHLGSDGDPDAHARWCIAAKERWHGKDMKGGIRGVIYQAQEQERRLNLWAALDYCVFQEQYIPHMVPELRTLGNALARHFKRA